MLCVAFPRYPVQEIVMAFTGAAVVKQVSDRIVRITGLSLAAGATGTIGLAGSAGTPPDVVLPESFKTEHYTYGGLSMSFPDMLDVTTKQTADSATAVPITITKIGSTLADFRMNLKNSSSGVSPTLEIYVKLHE